LNVPGDSTCGPHSLRVLRLAASGRVITMKDCRKLLVQYRAHPAQPLPSEGGMSSCSGALPLWSGKQILRFSSYVQSTRVGRIAACCKHGRRRNRMRYVRFCLHSCSLNGSRRINPHTNQNYDTATNNTSLPLIAALQRADTALIHGEKRQRASM
jgi:hypothetical protein